MSRDIPTTTRRGLVGALIGGGIFATTATGVDPPDQDTIGIGSVPGVFVIGPGESHTVPSDEVERYREVRVAGELQVDGVLEVGDE